MEKKVYSCKDCGGRLYNKTGKLYADLTCIDCGEVYFWDAGKLVSRDVLAKLSRWRTIKIKKRKGVKPE